LDGVKIVVSRKLQVFSNPSKTKIPSRTSSGPTRVSPEFKNPSQKPPPGLCPTPPDIFRILNLSPMTRFLGELYIYPSISNGSPLLVTPFFLLNKLTFFILRGQTHSLLELPFQVLVYGLSEARIRVSCVIHYLKLILDVESSSSALITLGAFLLDR
jgi:hypothetical protein